VLLPALLAVAGAPSGWQVELLGAGRPVEAVVVEPDGSAVVRLRLTPPGDAPADSHELTVRARGVGEAFGTRALTSIPIVAGESEDIDITIDLPGTPLPFSQSLALIWPLLTGLLAAALLLFAIGYVACQRQEVRA